MTEVKIYNCRSYKNDAPTAWSQADAWVRSDNLDISDLMHEDYSVNQAVDIGNTFSFTSGSSTFVFRNDFGDFLSFISNDTNLSNPQHEFGLEVIEDDVPIFWGMIDKESIIKDNDNLTIEFECVDWTKKLIEFFTDAELPDLLSDQLPITITRFLQNVFLSNTGNDFIESVSVNVLGLDETMLGGNYDLLRINHMKIIDMITELQKAYGAYIFIDENRILQFVSREDFVTADAIAIDDLIYEPNEIDNLRVKESYNSIVCNLDGSFTFVTDTSPYTETRATDDVNFLRYDNGNFVVTDINGDLNYIPSKYKYLDLRQKLTVSNGTIDFGRSYYLFPSFTAEQVWSLYKSILAPYEKKTCIIRGLSVNLYQEVTYDGSSYRVFELTKNPNQNNTELVLHKILD